jgi:hypothetical protein
MIHEQGERHEIDNRSVALEGCGVIAAWPLETDTLAATLTPPNALQLDGKFDAVIVVGWVKYPPCCDCPY